MKFIISRTSELRSDVPPCDGARKESYKYIDRRTVKSLADARKAKWGAEFFARGENHREEKSGDCGIARDLGPRDYWVIEFETLEELLAFQDKHGDLVLGRPLFDLVNGPEREIEIYDGYRE